MDLERLLDEERGARLRKSLSEAEERARELQIKLLAALGQKPQANLPIPPTESTLDVLQEESREAKLRLLEARLDFERAWSAWIKAPEAGKALRAASVQEAQERVVDAERRAQRAQELLDKSHAAQGKTRMDYERRVADLEERLLAERAEYQTTRLELEKTLAGLEEENRSIQAQWQERFLEAERHWTEARLRAQTRLEESLRAQETHLRQERGLQEEERLRLEAARKNLEEENEALRKELSRRAREHHFKLVESKAQWEKTRQELEERIQKLRRELDASENEWLMSRRAWEADKRLLEEGHAGDIRRLGGAIQAERENWRAHMAASAAKLHVLQAQRERLRSELKAAWQQWRASLSMMRRQLEALKNRPQPPQPPALPPVVAHQEVLLQEAPQEPLQEAAPLPPIEPSLDPGWSKIVSALSRPTATAYDHLRRLAAARLPEGPRTLLRLAAGELARMQDVLKSVERLMEESLPAPGEGRVEPVLDAALTAWEAPLRARGISILRKIEGNLPKVPLQAEALRIALYQILRNVHEALPKGGCLTVLASPHGEGGLQLTFSDTGTGFSEAALDHLFAPFRSEKKGHLGIGLALARRVLRNLGGDAEGGNTPAGGASVSLIFPPARTGEELPAL